MIKVLVYLLATLQLHFLEKYKILIRGVVTSGEIYVDDQLVFGEGLIRAVEQESNAKYPRIILDKERIPQNVRNRLHKDCVLQDEDDEYYINFFEIVGTEIEINMGFIKSGQESMAILKENIVELVRTHGKYNRENNDKASIEITDKIISKYLWLLSKFNDYCELNYAKLIKYEELIKNAELPIGNSVFFIFLLVLRLRLG